MSSSVEVNGQAEAALWLLAQLPPDVQRKVRRRFALRTSPPEAEWARYERELKPLGDLLRGLDSRPGWTFPVIPRADYDASRLLETSSTYGAVSSATLVTRYG